MRLGIIVDSSKVVAEYKAEKVLSTWELEMSEMKKATSFSERATPSLFTTDVSTLLTLDSAASVKSMNEILKKYIKEKKKLDFIYSGFLILAIGVNRTSTKALEKSITELGGTVDAISKKDEGSTSVQRLLNDVNLNRQTEEFVKDHVGESVDKLITVLRIVEDIPKDKQQYITIESLAMRMSGGHGQIEPWGVERAILNGNVTKAVQETRRVLEHSAPHLLVAILKRNFTMMMHLKSLESTGVTDRKVHMETTGIRSPGQYNAVKGKSRKVSLPDIMKIVEIIAEYEAKMKGAEVTDADLNMEILVVRLTKFF